MRNRVVALLALAQHPNTPRAEAESALAMASKLMQKYGIDETQVRAATVETDEVKVVIQRVTVAGKYRVRRAHLLYAIALIHSCVGYRDFDDGDACEMVLYGRASDILATRTLFTAADALGARLIPRGDRSARVAWWKGFQRGIEEVLSAARGEFVAETPGAGLVLADRVARAEEEKRATAPPLRATYSYADSSSSAYGKGVAAGRGFGASGRSFANGVRGELG